MGLVSNSLTLGSLTHHLRTLQLLQPGTTPQPNTSLGHFNQEHSMLEILYQNHFLAISNQDLNSEYIPLCLALKSYLGLTSVYRSYSTVTLPQQGQGHDETMEPDL